jgi:hypothetical protein
MISLDPNYVRYAWNEYGICEDEFKKCVYCRVKLKRYAHGKGNVGDKATIEHIDNVVRHKGGNLCLCCNSCNASKGMQHLAGWFKSQYCKDNNIGPKTIAPVVKKWIKGHPTK